MLYAQIPSEFTIVSKYVYNEINSPLEGGSLDVVSHNLQSDNSNYVLLKDSSLVFFSLRYQDSTKKNIISSLHKRNLNGEELVVKDLPSIAGRVVYLKIMPDGNIALLLFSLSLSKYIIAKYDDQLNLIWFKEVYRPNVVGSGGVNNFQVLANNNLLIAYTLTVYTPYLSTTLGSVIKVFSGDKGDSLFYKEAINPIDPVRIGHIEPGVSNLFCSYTFTSKKSYLQLFDVSSWQALKTIEVPTNSTLVSSTICFIPATKKYILTTLNTPVSDYYGEKDFLVQIFDSLLNYNSTVVYKNVTTLAPSLHPHSINVTPDASGGIYYNQNYAKFGKQHYIGYLDSIGNVSWASFLNVTDSAIGEVGEIIKLIPLGSNDFLLITKKIVGNYYTAIYNTAYTTYRLKYNKPIVSTNNSIAKSKNILLSAKKMLGEKTTLSVEVLNNVSATYFVLHTKSNNNQPLSIIITDVLGKIMETKNGIPANGIVNVGMANYNRGIYIVQVIQNGKRQVIKLFKK